MNPCRLNKYIASASKLSRRAADTAIADGRVWVNGQVAMPGSHVSASDTVTLDGVAITPPAAHSTILLHKPVGYVVSRNGQGSQTVYDLLPTEYQSLQPVGRLDKNSSGLLLLTDDGEQANQLTHPRFAKTKIYEVTLDKPLQPLQQQLITDHGLMLEDGLSKLQLEKLDDTSLSWRVIMQQGRNRQIRRTFAALNYTVVRLHRTQFGAYQLGDLRCGSFDDIN